MANVPHDASGESTWNAFWVGRVSQIIEIDHLHRNSVAHLGTVVIPAARVVAEAGNLGVAHFLKQF